MKIRISLTFLILPHFIWAQLFAIQAIPNVVTVLGGGTFCNSATITATGGEGGIIYFQGINSGGTSLELASTSQIVTSTGQYYFRSYNAESGWGAEGSVNVTIDIQTSPVIVSGGGIVCLRISHLAASGGDGGTIYWQGSDRFGTSKLTPATGQNVTANGNYYFRAYNLGCGWGTSTGKTVTFIPSTLVLDGIASNGLRRAVLNVRSSQKVRNRSGYEAGNYILLNNGFSAENGSVFTAEIKACN